MDTLRDYLNPARIYTDGLHDVGVSNLESTTPTVKESSLVRSGKNNRPAPIRENLTTESAESVEKCRVGQPGYPTANGSQVKNGTGIEEIERGTINLQVAKPGTETVPNCGTETCQSAEWAAKGVTVTTASSHGAPITYQAIQFPGPCTVATPFFAACAWCGPERIGWFSVQFWVRSDYGKRKWMSVTQDWKKKVKYCPMCGRKLEVEG
jgi:hypothetical protein